MSCGYTYPQIDAMLVTDVWDLVDHMSYEPPMHILMQYIAPTFGFKQKERKATSGKQKKVSLQQAAKSNGKVNLAAIGGGKLLHMSNMPAHIAASARQAAERMKAG